MQNQQIKYSSEIFLSEDPSTTLGTAGGIASSIPTGLVGKAIRLVSPSVATALTLPLRALNPIGWGVTLGQLGVYGASKAQDAYNENQLKNTYVTGVDNLINSIQNHPVKNPSELNKIKNIYKDVPDDILSADKKKQLADVINKKMFYGYANKGLTYGYGIPAATLAAGGAYGLYKLYKYFKNKKSAEEKNEEY